MRKLHFFTFFLLVLIVSACELVPRELKEFADSITTQGYGEATVWLLGGDVIVVNVTHSPIYDVSCEEIEAVARKMASQAIEYNPTPVESIAVTFYREEIAENPDKMRELIFLVRDGKPQRIKL